MAAPTMLTLLFAFLCLSLKYNLSSTAKFTEFYSYFVNYTCSIEDVSTLHRTMHYWMFSSSNLLHETFPIDTIKENYVREVRNALFSEVYPKRFKSKLYLVAYSDNVLSQILDMHPAVVTTTDFLSLVGGNPDFLRSFDTIPLAHRYGGHQFGYWSGQLGDGRAVMIGEYVDRNYKRWELQLKGSGLTPYSRRGDGRAVLRSSVREFLCSEAMHYLGIPTSRAASLVVTDDPITRDQFYNGNLQEERGAIVLRVAPSWFRIGSLEILTKNGETRLLRQLVDFVINNHFPDIDEDDDNRYLAFFSTITSQTAKMIAKWQSVGFTHGVCNTDNFSLLSVTIDYGPFGFLDAYDPKFVPNTSDDERRYSYENQPDVGHFNLDKLRIALLPLLSKHQRSQMNTILKQYVEIYKEAFMRIVRRKLGFRTVLNDEENFVAILLKMMEGTKADFTMTFRELGEITIDQLKNDNIPSEYWSLKILQKHKGFPGWVEEYVSKLARQQIDETSRRKLMNKTNPRYVLRNWMAQRAIEKAKDNDFTEVRKILRVLETPFTTQLNAENSGYSRSPPSWAATIKVSCSS